MDIMDIKRKHALPSATEALPGRDMPMPVIHDHTVLGTPLTGPFPSHLETAMFGLGCFWGAERVFWSIPGVYTTAVGYAAGKTPNPTYDEVCTGQTGHNEVVLVVFDRDLCRFTRRVLGGSQPHPRHASGQRLGDAVSVRNLYLLRQSSRVCSQQQKQL